MHPLTSLLYFWKTNLYTHSCKCKRICTRIFTATLSSTIRNGIYIISISSLMRFVLLTKDQHLHTFFCFSKYSKRLFSHFSDGAIVQKSFRIMGVGETISSIKSQATLPFTNSSFPSSSFSHSLLHHNWLKAPSAFFALRGNGWSQADTGRGPLKYLQAWGSAWWQWKIHLPHWLQKAMNPSTPKITHGKSAKISTCLKYYWEIYFGMLFELFTILQLSKEGTI